jgi:hypothetical protein
MKHIFKSFASILPIRCRLTVFSDAYQKHVRRFARNDMRIQRRVTCQIQHCLLPLLVRVAQSHSGKFMYYFIQMIYNPCLAERISKFYAHIIRSCYVRMTSNTFNQKNTDDYKPFL